MPIERHFEEAEGDTKLAAEARYSDGNPVRRRDQVYIPGEPGNRTYRVIGSNPARQAALIQGQDMRVHRVPYSALAKVGGGGGRP